MGGRYFADAENSALPLPKGASSGAQGCACSTRATLGPPHKGAFLYMGDTYLSDNSLLFLGNLIFLISEPSWSRQGAQRAPWSLANLPVSRWTTRRQCRRGILTSRGVPEKWRGGCSATQTPHLTFTNARPALRGALWILASLPVSRWTTRRQCRRGILTSRGAPEKWRGRCGATQTPNLAFTNARPALRGALRILANFRQRSSSEDPKDRRFPTAPGVCPWEATAHLREDVPPLQNWPNSRARNARRLCIPEGCQRLAGRSSEPRERDHRFVPNQSCTPKGVPAAVATPRRSFCYPNTFCRLHTIGRMLFP